jgi:nucleoside-diphosphate-sugar epimerase
LPELSSRVLVTGASGFIGKRLCQVLLDHDYMVRAALRRPPQQMGLAAVEHVIVGDIGSDSCWDESLQDVDYVVHLAARVHVMKESVRDPLAQFREVNTAATARLARQAAEQGVRRFVYLSSIKVNGEATAGRPFFADDKPDPQDPYGVSKAEAELQLRSISEQSNMEVTIVRPPLVYGSGVGGNFLRLMRLLERHVPLPLASIRNSRSMVTLNNLTNLLIRCLEHPGAADEIFLASDGEDWSTPALLRCIAEHLGVSGRLFPFPPALLRLAGRLSGQPGVVNRLCDSLEVDINKTRELLDWVPLQSPDEAVRQAVEWYLKNKLIASSRNRRHE